jgi:hypothetical protein
MENLLMLIPRSGRALIASPLILLAAAALADDSPTVAPRANPALQRFVQDLALSNPDVLAAGAALGNLCTSTCG